MSIIPVGQSLSIVVPAYNEGKRLADTCRKISNYFTEHGASFEVIIVDDGSTDNTSQVAKELSTKYDGVKFLVNKENRGKGYSVRRGILETKGDYVLFTDADLSTPIEEAAKLLKYLQEGCDVAIGSRALPGSDVRIHQPFYREYSGRIFNLLMKAVTSLKINDTQCGFKCFGKKAAKDIFSRQALDGFSFDVEDLYIAKKLGYKVKEVPVVWLNSESTTVSFIKHSIQMFIDLLRIRMNDCRGRYSQDGKEG